MEENFEGGLYCVPAGLDGLALLHHDGVECKTSLKDEKMAFEETAL